MSNLVKPVWCSFERHDSQLETSELPSESAPHFKRQWKKHGRRGTVRGTRWLTYLGPPAPAGALGDELSPSGMVAGNTSDFIMSATATDTLMSSMNVSRHVRFGLPCLLHPPSGVQSITRLAGLDVGRRSTCPMNLLRLDEQKYIFGIVFHFVLVLVRSRAPSDIHPSTRWCTFVSLLSLQVSVESAMSW